MGYEHVGPIGRPVPTINGDRTLVPVLTSYLAAIAADGWIIDNSTITLTPNAPVTSSSTSIITTGLTINWARSVTDIAHSSATGYFLDVATNGTFTVLVVNNFSVGNVTSYNVTGLTPSTQYWIRLRAVNIGGTSGNSNVQSPTTSSVVATYKATVGGETTLTHRWTLDETSGQALDTKGSINSTTHTPLLTQNSLLIDGTGKSATYSGTEYTDFGVQTSLQFQGTAPFSFESVIKIPSATSAGQCIAGCFDSGVANGWLLFIDATTGNVVFARFGGGTQVFYNPGSSISFGVSQHILATYDGSTMHLYLNGIEIGTGQATVLSIAAHTGHFKIGQDSNSGNSLQGTLDELASYSSALSASTATIHSNLALATNFKTLVGNETTLLHRWTLDETSGQSLDSKGSINSSTHTATLAQPSLLLDGTGKSASYDGTGSQYTDFGTQTSLQFRSLASFGFEAVIKLSSIPSHGQTIMCCADSGFTNGWLWFIDATTGNVVFAMFGGGASLFYNTGVSVPTGVQTHLFVTFDGTTIHIYSDGTEIGPGQVSTINIGTFVGTFRIGLDASSGDAFVGNIDELAIYSGPLSTGNITTHSLLAVGNGSTSSGINVNGGDTKLGIFWLANQKMKAYNVKRSIVSGGPYTNIATNVTGLHYIDTSLTNGTTYYYVVSGTNANGETTNSVEASGTPVHLTALSGTLQSNLDAQPAGSTYTVPEFIFRESVNINQQLTVIFQIGGGIRGSDVWTSWTNNGNGTWTSVNTLPANFYMGNGAAFGMGGWYGETIDNLHTRGEQCYRNGVALRSMVHGTTPVSGQFAQLSDTDLHIMIADNPSGQLMEVTTRQTVLTYRANGIKVQAGDFRHCANDVGNNVGLVNFLSNSNCTLSDSIVYYGHGTNLGVWSTSYPTILRCELAYGGQTNWLFGGDSGGDLNIVIRGIEQHHGNAAQYSTAWEAGNKIAACRTTLIEYSLFHDNDAMGLWFDIDCQGVTIRYCRMYNNRDCGLQYEVSPGSTTNITAPIVTNGAQIYDNVFWNNSLQTPAFGGVCSELNFTGSHDSAIYNNVVGTIVLSGQTTYGIRINWYYRGDQADNNPNGAGLDVNVHNNQGFSDQVTFWDGTSATGTGNSDVSNVLVTGAAATALMAAYGIS